MLKIDIVKTKAGRDAIAFEAWDERTGMVEQKMIWFDEIDGHLVLSNQLDRIDRKLTTLTISK